MIRPSMMKSAPVSAWIFLRVSGRLHSWLWMRSSRIGSRWPLSATNLTRPELISFYDLLPTLCEVAGAQAPADRNLCGRSYLNLALNKKLEQPWRNVLFGHFRYAEMARDARYKVILRNNGAGPNELYDLRADPREKTNQYDNPLFLQVRERLTRELEGWRKKFA